MEDSIGHDLAVTGVSPKLVLPNLSGVNEGPGFPNLSCLGLLSDRVLGAELGEGVPENLAIMERPGLMG